MAKKICATALIRKISLIAYISITLSKHNKIKPNFVTVDAISQSISVAGQTVVLRYQLLKL